jgi:hypothetical protein
MYVNPQPIVYSWLIELLHSIGRADDVVILASGENVVPAPMESIIISSPLIGGTLIFGRGRNQVGVLLEPAPGVEVSNLVEFRHKIWCALFSAYPITVGLFGMKQAGN